MPAAQVPCDSSGSPRRAVVDRPASPDGDQADRAIAQAVSDAVKAERKKAKKPAAGSSDKAKGKGKKRG